MEELKISMAGIPLDGRYKISEMHHHTLQITKRMRGGMKLFVKRPEGGTLQIEVRQDSTIQDVMTQIQVR